MQGSKNSRFPQKVENTLFPVKFPWHSRSDCLPLKTALPWKHIEMHDIRHGTICQSWLMAQIVQNGSYSGWCCKTLGFSSTFSRPDFLNKTLCGAASQSKVFSPSGLKTRRCRTKGFYWKLYLTWTVWHIDVLWTSFDWFSASDVCAAQLSVSPPGFTSCVSKWSLSRNEMKCVCSKCTNIATVNSFAQQSFSLSLNGWNSKREPDSICCFCFCISSHHNNAEYINNE